MTTALATPPAMPALAPRQERPEPRIAGKSILEVRDCSIFYGTQPAVRNVSLHFPVNSATAIIGPSGCGKSTLLRSLNRMNDPIPGVRTEGSILYRGADIHEPGVDPAEVRRLMGMVFQKPNPFPKTIFDNIAWGPRINGFAAREGKTALAHLVERSLEQAGLWNEVKDRLHKPALSLSGGQRQRLCIARALANGPEIFLMDEPCSALDPISTGRIEELIIELKSQYTIVIVTHNMEQAARVSDQTAFMLMGELVEFSPTEIMFVNPRRDETQRYITGRFG